MFMVSSKNNTNSKVVSAAHGLLKIQTDNLVDMSHDLRRIKKGLEGSIDNEIYYASQNLKDINIAYALGEFNSSWQIHRENLAKELNDMCNFISITINEFEKNEETLCQLTKIK
jgi:hypothetical protein